MRWIDRLESKLGRFAVPNVTVILIAGQVLIYLASHAPPPFAGEAVFETIGFDPSRVAAGEWWRLITFAFTPPGTNALFAFFFWYLFYLFGTTLEAQWGAFRYNVYLLLGYFASLALGMGVWFATGLAGQVASNAFLYGSVFLAFARLYPDFTMYIFFVFPVKARWLALFQWVMYGLTVLSNPLSLAAAMVFASVFNYLVFFGREIVQGMRHRHRKMQFQARSLQGKGVTRQRMAHQCRVCGLSSADSPRTQFRYCSDCGGNVCYCPEHIGNHEHVQVEPAPEKEPA
ncbi:MAG: rhomboid family intramembrane serine protease [Pirellulales bacterium]